METFSRIAKFVHSSSFIDQTDPFKISSTNLFRDWCLVSSRESISFLSFSFFFFCFLSVVPSTDLDLVNNCSPFLELVREFGI